ncbi:Fc receptor-like A isoform X2 [Fukomys damarensis]|uniref:Fc receptor-like A isoform X2 n=1 Tax=Fukomys damarensis TaxID=885580 RepID=UPI00053FD862|nr:Fc receptor-like A isoform X2 [Fukomys damarensis]
MKLGYALTAWALYLSPAMLWAVPMLPATASFSGCPSSMASSAAILEILECGGSVSTKESSCLTNDDGTSTEEAGFQLKGYTFSEPFHLIVSYERFPAPVLRASPSAEPHEGSPVTLSCQTKLSPQRSATRLFFSFYKDGKKVRSRDLSSEFQILTASLEHSGSYWCEAATEDSQVWKLSPRLEVRVQGPSTSAASPTFNPVSQRSVAPETRADPPEPVPPLATPTSEPPVFSSPDPHLHHRMGILLKHTQDIRDLLGYLLVELRDLSGRLKPKTTEPPAK